MNIDNWALVGVLVVLFRKLVKKKKPNLQEN